MFANLFGMEWTNELVIEFLELIQKEPCLWYTRKCNVNRNLVMDSWTRIKNNFSVPMEIEDLKKKKNCLFTQYRDYKRKVKDSIQSGSEEKYKPSWFAFELMNSFLGAVYDRQDQPPLDTEFQEFPQCKLERPPSRESNTDTENLSDIRRKRGLSQDSNSSTIDSHLISPNVVKRRRGMQNTASAKWKIDNAFSITKQRYQQQNTTDICELYGKLLVHRLKSLDEDAQLRLMNDIDNLAFKYLIEAKKPNHSCPSISSPT